MGVSKPGFVCQDLLISKLLYAVQQELCACCSLCTAIFGLPSLCLSSTVSVVAWPDVSETTSITSAGGNFPLKLPFLMTCCLSACPSGLPSRTSCLILWAALICALHCASISVNCLGVKVGTDKSMVTVSAVTVSSCCGCNSQLTVSEPVSRSATALSKCCPATQQGFTG